MPTVTPSTTLADEIAAGCGENVYKCYQCKRCTSGCPVASYAEMHPAMIMRAAQLGQADMIFDDRFLWLCTGCQTCTTRCPNEVDLAEVMDGLRQIALADGAPLGEKDVAAFHKVVLDTVRRHGRLFELGMILRLKTETGQYTKDLGMGLDLFRRGKIRLVACNVEGSDEIDALFDKNRGKG